MEIIKTFQGYNNFRKGKKIWRERDVSFDFPMGKVVCALCFSTFTANVDIFLICPGCINREIDWNGYSSQDSEFVYGLYSMNDSLMYVGVTKNPLNRCHNHRLTKNFKTMRIIRSFTNRVEADDYEKYSIWKLKPELNKLYDKSWTKVPDFWFRSLFGNIPEYTRVQLPTVHRKARTIKKNKKSRPVAKKNSNFSSTRCSVCNCNIKRGTEIKIDEGKFKHPSDCTPTPKATAKQRKANRKKKTQEARNKNSAIYGISKICAICNTNTADMSVVYIKDSKNNKAATHKVCYDARVKEIENRKTNAEI